MDQQEFLNAYIQRMLALNSELTNKNVMIETRFMLLEKKYKELEEQNKALIAEKEAAAVNTTAEPEEAIEPTETPSLSEDDQY
jgi:hypothetical protein